MPKDEVYLNARVHVFTFRSWQAMRMYSAYCMCLCVCCCGGFLSKLCSLATGWLSAGLALIQTFFRLLIQTFFRLLIQKVEHVQQPVACLVLSGACLFK